MLARVELLKQPFMLLLFVNANTLLSDVRQRLADVIEVSGTLCKNSIDLFELSDDCHYSGPTCMHEIDSLYLDLKILEPEIH